MRPSAAATLSGTRQFSGATESSPKRGSNHTSVPGPPSEGRDSAAPAEVAAPAITLQATVGLDDSTCASTSHIVVESEVNVWYCYTVTNTGDVALTLHSIEDSVLGGRINGVNFTLAPGTTVSTTQMGLFFPVWIAGSIASTVTWTAYNAGPNDVVTGTADVSVTLAQSSITLDVTVGTDPSVCAGTSVIEVDPGTEVTYCYTVFNSGNVTLNLHDLEDDQLGSLLSGFSYALSPGGLAFLLFTTTVNDSVVNTAIWNAYNPGPVNVASSQGSATVIVSDFIFADGFEAL